jgi:mono/diheme cytochrome c family protein
MKGHLGGCLPLLATIAVACLGAGVSSAIAAPGGAAAETPARPRYGDAVADIFAARCVSCHGPQESENDLRLDSYGAVMRGGQAGPVIVPSDPAASLALQKILGRDKPAMPPRGGKLKASEIAAVRAWIAAGALP